MSIKKNIYYSLGLIITGVVLVLAGLFMNFVKGTDNIVFPMGAGLLAVGIVKTIQLARIKKNPERLKEYEIAQGEERNIMISEKAAKTTLLLSSWAELIAMIIFGIFDNFTVYTTLSIVICAQLIFYVILSIVFQKKY